MQTKEKKETDISRIQLRRHVHAYTHENGYALYRTRFDKIFWTYYETAPLIAKSSNLRKKKKRKEKKEGTWQSVIESANFFEAIFCPRCIISPFETVLAFFRVRKTKTDRNGASKTTRSYLNRNRDRIREEERDCRAIF